MYASLFAYLIKEINDNTFDTRNIYNILNPVSSREILLCDYLKFHRSVQSMPINKISNDIGIFERRDTER